MPGGHKLIQRPVGARRAGAAGELGKHAQRPGRRIHDPAMAGGIPYGTVEPEAWRLSGYGGTMCDGPVTNPLAAMPLRRGAGARPCGAGP